MAIDFKIVITVIIFLALIGTLSYFIYEYVTRPTCTVCKNTLDIPVTSTPCPAGPSCPTCPTNAPCPPAPICPTCAVKADKSDWVQIKANGTNNCLDVTDQNMGIQVDPKTGNFRANPLTFNTCSKANQYQWFIKVKKSDGTTSFCNPVPVYGKDYSTGKMGVVYACLSNNGSPTTGFWAMPSDANLKPINWNYDGNTAFNENTDGSITVSGQNGNANKGKYISYDSAQNTIAISSTAGSTLSFVPYTS